MNFIKDAVTPRRDILARPDKTDSPRSACCVAFRKLQGPNEGNSMITRTFSSITSFVFVAAGVFFLGGFLLMPHLPPTPSKPVYWFEMDYWVTNWAGLLLGVPCGFFAARATWIRADRKRAGG